MNTGELIRELRRKYGNKALADIVPGAFAVITDELAKGGEVRIKNFGTFKRKLRHARKMPKLRDVTKVVTCPDMYVLKFKPSNKLKKTLR